MKLLRIKKDNFEEALRSLQNEFKIYIPKKEDDNVVFSELGNFKDMDYKFERTSHPIKEFVLPQNETLFYFLKDGSREKESFDTSKRILLGVRPCDAKTLKLLDFNFLDSSYIDPYYEKRRKNTFVISIACNEFGENCFCDALGDSPYKLNGVDAIIYSISNEELNLLIDNEVIFSFFKKYSEKIEEVNSEEEVSEKGKIAERATKPLPVKELKEKLPSLIGSTDLWKNISATCIECGVCTYLCPACYCFDINDITFGKGGKRLRSYDSCMFKEYTLEASGHNPRPTGAERWRQRLLHKFLYYPDLYDELGCSGCGRCIDKCPSKIDIREVINYAFNYK